MSRYENLENDIFSVFAAEEWRNENLPAFPANYKIPEDLTEFVRISILPSLPGYNIRSISGILILEIFSPAGVGSSRTYQIADILDTYLNGRTIGNTQFMDSVLDILTTDSVNESLTKVKYQISFNYNGVM